MSKVNVVIGQSGGPTTVINNSVRGVADELMRSGQVGEIYGAKQGILGVLQEELISLSSQDPHQIALLRQTPSAGAIGSCRYKLKADQAEDFERVVGVFKAHNVGYFFYAGGNDSMDTADKISKLAAEKGLDLVAIGLAKTIDNDVGGSLKDDGTCDVIDHTPGYGSVARYWALKIQQANEENKASHTSDPVLVIQMMGRKIGFIPAAARLADPERKMPLLVCLRESGLSLEGLREKANELLKAEGRCVIAVSEGFDVGDVGALKDSFGHQQFSTGTPVAEIIAKYLNDTGIETKGAARFNVHCTDQRHDILYASQVDLEEAYQVGANAGRLALAGEGGYMSTIVRKPGKDYEVSYDKVPLSTVANSERSFPKQWIANSTDVSDAFIHYASPFVGDLLEMTNLDLSKVAERKLPSYVPQGYRK